MFKAGQVIKEVGDIILELGRVEQRLRKQISCLHDWKFDCAHKRVTDGQNDGYDYGFMCPKCYLHQIRTYKDLTAKEEKAMKDLGLA
jgi:hypothetical protein